MELYIKKQISLTFGSEKEMTDFYRELAVDYPKFFKMDVLSKMGFLAAEKLLQNEIKCRETAVVCFTEAASLHADVEYQKTIRDEASFFPSPALFVYTLPNIVTGEIAIRHGFNAETACYVVKDFDKKTMCETVYRLFSDKSSGPQAIVAWLNWRHTGEATMFWIARDGDR